MDHNNHINTVQNQPKNINKKRERNRIKKKKYKLKIKHKKTNTTPKYTKPSLTVKTNHGWRWFTLKSKQLSLKQKKLLFQAHNLYKIKERNSSINFFFFFFFFRKFRSLTVIYPARVFLLCVAKK